MIRATLLAGAAWGIATVAPAYAGGAESGSQTYTIPAPAPAPTVPNSPEVEAFDGGGGGLTATSTGTSQTPNSDNNYLDDDLMWTNKITLKANVSDQYPVYCIPGRTQLKGHKATLDTQTVTPNTAANTSAPTQTQQYLQVVLDQSKAIPAATAKQTNCSGLKPNTDPLGFGPDDVGYVSNVDLGTLDSREGWDYGALFVPFKLQTTGKDSFATSGSIGAYLGYRFSWLGRGVSVSPIAFAGVSNIQTSASSGGSTSSQTVAGLSYGTGVVFTFKNSLQVGAVVGFDHVDSAQPYAYNDKPWVSFEIGYSFAQ
jgi:hypothetical protein